MTSIIVEDEHIAAQRLFRMIGEIDLDITNLAIIETIEETIHYLKEHKAPDIIFLDIHLGDTNSFELFKEIEVKSKVIFTTAYAEYAANAFRQNAIDYLLKPIKIEELKEAIVRVKNQPAISIESQIKESSHDTKDRFLIKFGNKLTVVKHEDIAYIYSQNKIGYFMLKNGTRVASDYKLQDLETMLSPMVFCRVNRQFIVHIDAIINMSTYSKARLNLKLNPHFDGDIIVSTEKTPEFKDWLKGRI